MKIPLIPSLPEDLLVWHFTASGEFTVRSAYHFGVRHQERMGAGGSSSGQNAIWRSLWNLCVPPKVKLMIWRLLTCSLATKYLLHRRIPLEDISCLRCGALMETDFYIFMECPYAIKVWEVASFDLEDWRLWQTSWEAWFDV